MERRQRTTEADNPPAAPAIDTHRIGVLDGVRAAAILIVVWYHIWQQSWLMPIFPTPSLARFGISHISLDMIPRTGYLFVDLLLLLSAFCLFLPYARAARAGRALPDVRTFYKKRLVRILPCYYLCVLPVFFLYSLPHSEYWTRAAAWQDLFATLTFTQTFRMETYIGTHINVVLWTAAIEMQFYLIFPWLAKAFTKKPLLTYLLMADASELYLRLAVRLDPDGLRMTLNQLIAFLGVFANGMAGAMLLVRLAERFRRTPRLCTAGTVGFFGAVLLLLRILRGAAAANPVQVYQAEYRFVLSLVFLLLILSLTLACRALRAVFDNRIARFFAAISYNLYIWHQWLAVRFKAWRIPYYEGDRLPNMTGNRPWQWQYTLLIFAVSIALAALLTCAFERPVSRALLAMRLPWRKTDTQNTQERKDPHAS